MGTLQIFAIFSSIAICKKKTQSVKGLSV